MCPLILWQGGQMKSLTWWTAFPELQSQFWKLLLLWPLDKEFSSVFCLQYVSEVLKIATWQRHYIGSWKALFTQHFCFHVSPVTRFSTPLPWGINSMQCHWKKEERDQYKTESPYHLYTRIFGVEISIAKGCHWVVLFTIDGFMWKLQSNLKSPFNLTLTKQNKQAKKQTN